MYAIYKFGRKTVRKTFENYESARQYARKLCRKATERSFLDTSNPMLGDYGYSIKRI
jgi:hypothetical protein